MTSTAHVPVLSRVSPRSRAGAARLGLLVGVACVATVILASCAEGPTEGPSADSELQGKAFDTPEEACEALIAAAEQFDVPALTEILGPDGIDLVVTEDPVNDRNQATAFAAEARVQHKVVRDPEQKRLATLVIGADEWPLPIPVVKQRAGWRFDTAAGRDEILYRRIGQNELDAIEVCRGYVEAQHEYALVKREGALVNQFAQRVVSTPGAQDGLAWQAPDGTWQGPVGEGIARVIAEGYTDRFDPYHGYYFKILKGQGPAAPMGEMDFVVDGAMIGGFAMAAAPAEYGVTGVKTFIVSHDGVVYEQDLGDTTLEAFRAMERFDPDPSWAPVASE